MNSSDVQVGESEKTGTAQGIKNMLVTATSNVLPLKPQAELSNLVWDCADIFRTKLGADKPMDVPTMKKKLMDCAKPVRMKVRKFAPVDASFPWSNTAELSSLVLDRTNEA